MFSLVPFIDSQVNYCFALFPVNKVLYCHILWLPLMFECVSAGRKYFWAETRLSWASATKSQLELQLIVAVGEQVLQSAAWAEVRSWCARTCIASLSV